MASFISTGMGVGPGVLRFWGIVFGMGITVLCGRWHLFAGSADRKGILISLVLGPMVPQ